MDKHTPGPWNIFSVKDGKAMSIVHGSHHKYCGPIGDVVPQCSGIKMEDARLIAAAPDLLAALKALLPRVSMTHYSSVEREDAEAALARAEGR